MFPQGPAFHYPVRVKADTVILNTHGKHHILSDKIDKYFFCPGIFDCIVQGFLNDTVNRDFPVFFKAFRNVDAEKTDFNIRLLSDIGEQIPESRNQPQSIKHYGS